MKKYLYTGPINLLPQKVRPRKACLDYGDCIVMLSDEEVTPLKQHPDVTIIPYTGL